MLWTVLVLTALGALSGAAVVFGGLYNIAATAEHTQPVYALLAKTMQRSVQLRARDVVVPPLLEAPERVQRGAACYRDRCAQCHGGPGVPADAIGMAMQPVPGSLIAAAHTFRARELYWITRHGIKMSGMPAWQYHLSEADLWAVVAFLQQLPALTPSAYGEMVAHAQPCRSAAPPAALTVAAAPAPEASAAASAASAAAAASIASVMPPSPAGLQSTTAPAALAERGHLALRMYGCHACHAIPGITGGGPQVGPPLAGFAGGELIAGRLANTQDNLVAWIRQPQRFDARTAMPDLGVTQEHALEMAAYLATLH